jgi:hypothetical protein
MDPDGSLQQPRCCLHAVVGRAMIEALLWMSAEQLAGPKQQGRPGGECRDFGWHGSQDGVVTLSNRKLRVSKPRAETNWTGPARVPPPGWVLLSWRTASRRGARPDRMQSAPQRSV